MLDLFNSLFQPPSGFINIQPHDALSALSRYHVVDVREPDEYDGDLGHIEGAELIPLATLPNAIERLRQIDKPVLVVCRSGGRSSRGAQLLTQAGLERVFNLSGGMMQWTAQRLPTCAGRPEPRARHEPTWSLSSAGAASCC